jgi:hypothetical protein
MRIREGVQFFAKAPCLQGFFVHFIDNRLYGDFGMVTVEPVVLFSIAKKKVGAVTPRP